MKKRIGFLLALILISSIVMLAACSDIETPDVPTGLTAVFGQTIGDIELPDKWTWNDGLDTPVGDAGTQFFYATYKNNYNVQIVLLFVNVTKAAPVYDLPDGLTAIFGDTLADIVLPAGWAWTNPAQSVGNAGERQHDAIFTPADTDNFDTVNKKISISVTPAMPAAPTAVQARYGDLLSAITLPSGWAWAVPGAKVGDVGTQKHNALYTPTNDNFQTATSSVTVIVNKAVPVYDLPDGLTAIFGDTLADIVLPAGWAWVNPAQSVGNAGERQHDAIFTPADTDNFDTVNKKISISVTPAMPIAPAATQATYGELLSEVALPSGWTWAVPGAKVGDVGTHTHNALYTPPDDNYQTAAYGVTVTVNKAVPEYDLPVGLTAVFGDTLDNVLLPSGWTWVNPEQPVGDAGQQQHTAVFTPADTNNYLTVTKELTIEVSYGFVQTSVGSTHSIALDAQGRIWTWGGNSYGQLGHGGITGESRPRLLVGVDGLTEVKTVAAGGSYSVAVDGQGRVCTWGYGGNGRLGHGGSGDENRPRMIDGVDGFTDIQAISASDFFVMALDGQGNIWTWGAGHTGSLGHGGTSAENRPRMIASGNNFAALPVFTAISAGYGMSMALDEDGNIWTWGGSANGQLGNGAPAEYTQVFRPQILTTGYGNEALPAFKAISAGRDHSMALDSNGRLWTWGYGLDGQLGHGVTAHELRPRMVEALTDIVKINAGTPVWPPTGKLVLDVHGNGWLADSSGNWVRA